MPLLLQARGLPAPPLDFVLDGFGLDAALGVLGGNAKSEEARQVLCAHKWLQMIVRTRF